METAMIRVILESKLPVERDGMKLTVLHTKETDGSTSSTGGKTTASTCSTLLMKKSRARVLERECPASEFYRLMVQEAF